MAPSSSSSSCQLLATSVAMLGGGHVGSSADSFRTSSATLVRKEPFAAGVALGAGLSFLLITIQKEFRILERCRLAYKSWWGTNDAPLRKPSPLLKAAGENVHSGEEGSVEVLVSHDMVASPTLHVTVLTLTPGAELPSQIARGAEFYYVVSGSGSFSQQYIHGTFDIQARDVFMVDPGSIRWITNRSGHENLVLLRAGDSGSTADPNRGDGIRMDPNLKTLTTVAMDQLRDGIRQVQKMARLRSFERPTAAVAKENKERPT